MGHGFRIRDGAFLDRDGRHALLRGVNLGGSTKVPFAPDGATHRGVDFDGWKSVSFVGRPFPLADADRHLDRIAGWGFDVLRLLVTWEAIEHAGPGEYDEAYLDYVREIVKKARARGLLVFVDPHHDVWSRWTGGDGAPFWCFEWAGLRADRFLAAQAVNLHALDWPANAQRVPCATMWTLFLAGDAFCPELRGVQQRLQDHYIAAVCRLMERVADQDNVLGLDTFNEPSNGYLGRGEDLTRGVRFMGDGPRSFSALEHLAAADGLTVRSDGGRVLNPEGVSIWARGCPWRRLGVWDLDADGRPVLARPDFFRARNGEPVDAWKDGLIPFFGRLRMALRRVMPDAILFIEGVPGVLATPWSDPDPQICDARHWYDVVALMTRRFDPKSHGGLSGKVRNGRDDISEEFTHQLRGISAVSRASMGNLPILIGEFGIPYEMNLGEAYASGDWSKHELLLDCNYRALEASLLHSTQWNYTSDNSHAHGDQWNDEDLSIFSPDDQADPADLDSGGRATRAFCRPYLRFCAGRPVRMAFDLERGVFEAAIEADPDVAAATIVFAPRLHYPGAPKITVSAGRARHDPVSQTIVWEHADARGELSITLEPA